jgi:aminoglycoside phosphotransferase family enzyme
VIRPVHAVTGWSGEPRAALAETYSGLVFFADDRAWKLKKPVDVGFRDFSTPEARAVACARPS